MNEACENSVVSNCHESSLFWWQCTCYLPLVAVNSRPSSLQHQQSADTRSERYEHHVLKLYTEQATYSKWFLAQKKTPHSWRFAGKNCGRLLAVFALTSGCCCLLHRPENIRHRLRRHFCFPTRWRRPARAIRHKAHEHKQHLLLYKLASNEVYGYKFSAAAEAWEGWKKTTNHTLEPTTERALLTLLILSSRVSMHFLPENTATVSLCTYAERSESLTWRGGLLRVRHGQGQSSCCVMKCEATKEDTPPQGPTTKYSAPCESLAICGDRVCGVITAQIKLFFGEVGSFDLARHEARGTRPCTSKSHLLCNMRRKTWAEMRHDT